MGRRSFIEIISQMLNVLISDIKLESNFVKDFSADSLDEVEILLAMEDEYSITFSDEDMLICKTVQSTINCLRRMGVNEGYLVI